MSLKDDPSLKRSQNILSSRCAFSRRGFLATTGLTAAALISRGWPFMGEALATANLTINRVLFKDLLAVNASQSLAKEPVAAARSLLTLAQAYRKTGVVHANAAFENAESARFVSLLFLDPFGGVVSKDPDVDDLQAMCHVLQGGKPASDKDIFKFDPAPYATNFGLALQTLGVGVSYVHPPAGIALTIIGTWAEPFLSYTGRPGVNLSTNPFPSTDYDQSQAQCLFTLREAVDVGEANHAFQGTLDSPLLRQRLGISTQTTLQDVEAQLPESVRASAKEALETDASQQPDALRQKLENQLWDQINGFGKQIKAMSDALAAEQDATKQNEAREKNRQSFAFTSSEINGGIQIFTFILGRVLGRASERRYQFRSEV